MTDERAAARALLDAILDRSDLARALELTPRRLNFLLYRLSASRRYVRFTIAKRDGTNRTISAPIVLLKSAQKRAAELLGAHYTPRACVHGYVAGKSIQMNADHHSQKRWVLRVDLKDFFPSIHFGRVRGLLMAAPFSLPNEVATTMAKLCCEDNQLPQGSPASPLLSNLVCRGLDRDLSRLARQHKCTYTRYCDDLVFSTNRRTFPPALAGITSGPGANRAVLGPALAGVIQSAGFVAHPEKIRLSPTHRRQMVTGLVVNKRVNVPRQLVGDIRMMLHVWRKIGIAAASFWYLTKYNIRNRVSAKPQPTFEAILRGKIQYIGSVRGWHDPLYVRLAGRLSQLDSSFKATKRSADRLLPTIVLSIYVEGRTDKPHIELALAHFKARGVFSDLRVNIEDRDRGADKLLDFCRTMSEVPHSHPRICLFDSDIPKIAEQVTDTNRDPKFWGNNVYSLTLPTPSHRAAFPGVCIELLYMDADLERKDGAGRRLFRSAEFDPVTRRHHRLDAYTSLPRPGAIIEDQVFDFSGTQLAISKRGFVEVVRSQSESISFEGFVPLFQALVSIRRRIADEGTAFAR